jgi:hypothetical protein
MRRVAAQRERVDRARALLDAGTPAARPGGA